MKKILVLFVLVSSACFGQDALKKQAMVEAKAHCVAMQKGDVPTLVKYLHPEMITSLGGKEKATELLKQTFGTLKTADATIESCEAGKMLDFKKENGEYRCLIQKTTVTVMNKYKLKVIQKGSMFGFYNEKNKNWTFVEGNKLTDQMSKHYFKDFKTSISIPEFEQEEIKMD